MEKAQRLEQLRDCMGRHGISGYIIEGTDPHQSEYPAPKWESRGWVTGFTGSAGIAALTMGSADLWVDPRYHLQGAEETADSEVIVHPVDLPSPEEVIPFFTRMLQQGDAVGLNKQEITLANWRTYTSALSQAGINTVLVDDLLDEIWDDRPGLPFGEVFEIPPESAGRSREEKVSQVREYMEELGAAWFVLSTLDDIAWILNLRGRDIAFNPLFLSYLFISSDRVVLCADIKKFSPALQERLNMIEIIPYENAGSKLSELLSLTPGNVLLDPAKTSMVLAEAIGDGVFLVEKPNITTLLKAKKHPAEIAGMEAVHIQDGAAVVSFLCWLENNWNKGSWNEITLAEKLYSFRNQREGFYQESFNPIIGYRSHGAVIHYRAQEKSAFTIDGRGLMIMDSGGQYHGGTTDITRTVLFGDPEEEEILDYTLVLKGHLKLADTPFPQGTRGFQLDALARIFLWEHGRQYGHGTGHGVGHMLCVHEGPASISAKLIDIPIEEGMVISNEPGLYRSGKYGIRIENLMYAKKGKELDFGQFFQWEILTLCPYERRLIDCSLLTNREIEQVDAYHQRVYQALSPLLAEDAAAWLYEKTLPLL